MKKPLSLVHVTFKGLANLFVPARGWLLDQACRVPDMRLHNLSSCASDVPRPNKRSTEWAVNLFDRGQNVAMLTISKNAIMQDAVKLYLVRPLKVFVS